MIKGKLADLRELPVAWTIVDTEEEARAGLNERKYYGALVLLEDLSSGALSLATPEPKPATVTILANEGKNAQASTVVRQVLGQAMKTVGGELSKQMLGQIGQQTPQIPVAAAQALLSPIVVKEEIVHQTGENHASGNAPGLLTRSCGSAVWWPESCCFWQGGRPWAPEQAGGWSPRYKPLQER
ncbi:YhgE/Pip domain-containing protein [Paenibacillaceae bacterium WGS1546]|uniref:YhgE/Pip domain-containing protein n=1 Tax=Cohnella sp. WGS1546 TaxID=3366810 RepID=UPI00372D84DB